MKEKKILTSEKRTGRLPLWALAAIILGVIGLDQLTKWLAVVHLQGEPSVPLWENVLHLTFVKNEGAAFGMLSNSRWVFMVISTVAIIGISVYLFGFCKESGWVKISLAMIVGGGIGNMIDRLALGYVVDFIDFTLINFAVFNVADSFVTVGAGILIVCLLLEQIRELRAEKAKKLQVTEAQDDEAQAPSDENAEIGADAKEKKSEESEHESTDVQ